MKYLLKNINLQKLWFIFILVFDLSLLSSSFVMYYDYDITITGFQQMIPYEEMKSIYENILKTSFKDQYYYTDLLNFDTDVYPHIKYQTDINVVEFHIRKIVDLHIAKTEFLEGPIIYIRWCVYFTIGLMFFYYAC